MPRPAGFVSRAWAVILMARLLGASASTEAAWQQVAKAAKASGYCNKAYDIRQITQAPNDNPRNWVEAHNHYRSCHGTPAVIWDPDLANYAKAWAEVVAAHCDGVTDVINFVKASGREPHDPESYNQKPSNTENIAVFESPGMNIIEHDEATTVESWYREMESQCPDKGLSPGCGNIINHYAAVVWKQNFRIGCYSAVRGMFKVVSCRYASAAEKRDQGCDTAGGGAKCASEGPPEPQVPALVTGTSCPGLTGPNHGPGLNLSTVPVGTVLGPLLEKDAGVAKGSSDAQPRLGGRIRRAMDRTANLWRSMANDMWKMMHPGQPAHATHSKPVDNALQFWRSAAGSLRSRMHPAPPRQASELPPVTRLYDTRVLPVPAHSSGVPLFVALPIGLAGLLAAIAVRVAHAVHPTEPEHGDRGALLDPEQRDVE